ncbi:MAG: DUF4333 domain-containing protein [Actinophytocola sp.]|nr:DUF4333 domain-containing protein [Actinophytocola sp.]
MSTPYGGNDPQQWGQQPYGEGAPADPSSGGVPAQDPWAQQPGMGGYPPPSGPQPQQPGYEQQWQQQPGGGYPFSGPQPQQPQQPQQAPQPGQLPGYEQQWQQQPGGGYPPPGQPPYGYPGGYQQYGQPPMQQPPKKSKAPLWIGLGLVVVLGVAAVVLWVWPALLMSKVFDAKSVEQGVEQVLGENFEVEQGSASCPAEQEVKQGHTFTCTVKIGGEDKNVPIKVLDEASPPRYEVGNPE